MARSMALAFGALTVTGGWATLEVGLGGWTALTSGGSLAVTTALLTALFVSVYGNLGYMGLVIERIHGNELRTRELAACFGSPHRGRGARRTPAVLGLLLSATRCCGCWPTRSASP